MAKSTVQGLTVMIGADTKGFTDAMKQIDAEAKNIAKDLKTVNENLKLDPKNADKAADSLDLLKQQAQKASEKVDLIKKSIQDLNKQYSNGKISADEYNTSMDHLKILLSQAQHEQDLTNEKIKQFGTNADDAGKHVLSLGDLIKGNLISDAIMTGMKAVASHALDIGKKAVQAVKEISKAVFNFLKDSVKIAEENKQTLAKVGQIFEENSKDIVAWSKSAVNAMGITSGEAQAAAAVFGNMFKALDVGIVKTDKIDTNFANMSMDLVQLAADVAAFNNTTTDKVLEAFQSGLAGTSRQLREYGIVINDAAIKQKALELGLVADVKEMTEADKITARYALMMEQAQHQMGQFARETNSVTVQKQILLARIRELKGEIGDKLTPVIAQLMSDFNKYLESEAGKKLFDGLVESVENVATAVQNWINDGGLETFISDVGTKAQEVVDGILNISKHAEEIIPTIETLAEKIAYLFGIETDASQTKRAIKEVKDDITELASVYSTSEETIKNAAAVIAEQNGLKLYEVYQDWERYEPQIVGYLNSLQSGYTTDLIDGAAETIAGFASQNKTSLSDIYTNWETYEPQIVEFAGTLGTGYDEKFKTAIGYIEKFAQDNDTNLSDVLSHWSTYEPQILTWLTTVQDDFDTTAQAVAEDLESLPTKTQEEINKFTSIDYSAFDTATARVRTFTDGIKQAVMDAIHWLDEFFKATENVDTSLIDQSTPEWQYGDASWNPYDPFQSFASGGRPKVGRIARVNDDAGHRPEMFIPDVPGTILNGDKTEKLLNNINNSRNISGGINIYVTSYGANAEEIADELGAAMNRKLRMSGAIL